MIVILNNGIKIRIPKEVGQQMMLALLKDGNEGHRWQCMTDLEKNETSGFNFVHVAAVCSEEDIL